MSVYLPTHSKRLESIVAPGYLIAAVIGIALTVTALTIIPGMLGYRSGELRAVVMQDRNPVLSMGGVRSDNRMGFVTVTGSALNISRHPIHRIESLVEFLDRT